MIQRMEQMEASLRLEESMLQLWPRVAAGPAGDDYGEM